MKRLLLSICLGLSAVAGAPTVAHAGTFGLFTNCCGFGCGGCSKCSVCVKPYNAFTPVLCGNITCMGCQPFAPPAQNCGGYGYGGPSYGAEGCGAGGSCGTGSSYSGGVMSGPVYSQGQAPTQNLPPLPPQYAQPQLLPAPGQQPVLVPSPSPATSSLKPNLSGTVQAGYRPATTPAYNPYLYYNSYAPTGAVPYYWNAK